MVANSRMWRLLRIISGRPPRDKRRCEAKTDDELRFQTGLALRRLAGLRCFGLPFRVRLLFRVVALVDIGLVALGACLEEDGRGGFDDDELPVAVAYGVGGFAALGAEEEGPDVL